MSNQWRFPNPATPLGSSSYYGIRFAPRSLRDDLAALVAWRQQIRGPLHNVSDPDVARAKLQWWREELQRSFSGEPRHPLSEQLAPTIEKHALSAELFVGMTWAVENELLCRPFQEHIDLSAHCEQDLGALFVLLARCHGETSESLLTEALRLGGFCAQVYRIRDSGLLLRKGRPLAPLDLLNDTGLAGVGSLSPEFSQRLPMLLEMLAELARTDLGDGEPGAEIPVMLRVQTRILRLLLSELADDGFRIAHHSVRLTPIRKLWHAWGESRR